MTATVDFEAITALKDEAAALQEEANGYEEQYRDAINRRDEKLVEMRQVMDKITGAPAADRTNPQPNAPAATQRNSAPTKGSGKPSKSSPSAPASRGGGRRKPANSGQKSLKEVVLEIFPRKSWTGFEGIDAASAKQHGLRITDVGKIVKAEGQWTTGSDNMDNQINNAVYALKNDGILDRNKTEEHGVRYFIIKK